MSSRLKSHSVILGPIWFCDDHAGYAGWDHTERGDHQARQPGRVLRQKWRSGFWKPLRQELSLREPSLEHRLKRQLDRKLHDSWRRVEAQEGAVRTGRQAHHTRD